MVRISWMSKVRSEEVREKCLQVTLEARLRQRRLGWLGHIQRMHWSRYPKVTLWGRLSQGSRRPGGQKKKWLDICSQDLRDLDLMEEWKVLSENRSTWAERIRAVEMVTKKEECRYKRKHETTLQIHSPLHPQLSPQLCFHLHHPPLPWFVFHWWELFRRLEHWRSRLLKCCWLVGAVPSQLLRWRRSWRGGVILRSSGRCCHLFVIVADELSPVRQTDSDICVAHREKKH